jgi:hypothetical protein
LEGVLGLLERRAWNIYFSFGVQLLDHTPYYS